jgi:hypothetical protein
MDRILLIASKSHSGSTLLDMLLSGHPQFLGTGEVRPLIEDRLRPRYIPVVDERRCSCGSVVSRCALWSRFLEFVEAEPSGDFGRRYARLLSLAGEVSPEARVLVDSSKYLEHLQRLLGAVEAGALGGAELRVVHLIKDVRSYVASMKRIHGLKSWQLFQTSRKWHKSHARIRHFLSSRQVPSLQVGYEELCFEPGAALERICDFAGIEFDERMTDLRNSRGHIGLGNSMRNHPEKSRQIRYDHRWFLQPDIQLCYLLSPRVRRFNERHVYPHPWGEGGGAPERAAAGRQEEAPASPANDSASL